MKSSNYLLDSDILNYGFFEQNMAVKHQNPCEDFISSQGQSDIGSQT
jgi:hypothetical protein